MYLKISLNNFTDVNKFVSIMQGVSEDMILHSGRFAVDAKSVMGIFSLDLSKPLMLEIDAHGEDIEEEKFVRLLKDFEVKR